MVSLDWSSKGIMLARTTHLLTDQPTLNALFDTSSIAPGPRTPPARSMRSWNCTARAVDAVLELHRSIEMQQQSLVDRQRQTRGGD